MGTLTDMRTMVHACMREVMGKTPEGTVESLIDEFKRILPADSPLAGVARGPGTSRRLWHARYRKSLSNPACSASASSRRSAGNASSVSSNCARVHRNPMTISVPVAPAAIMSVNRWDQEP